MHPGPLLISGDHPMPRHRHHHRRAESREAFGELMLYLMLAPLLVVGYRRAIAQPCARLRIQACGHHLKAMEMTVAHGNCGEIRTTDQGRRGWRLTAGIRQNWDVSELRYELAYQQAPGIPHGGRDGATTILPALRLLRQSACNADRQAHTGGLARFVGV